jgi:hypothetical protein
MNRMSHPDGQKPAHRKTPKEHHEQQVIDALKGRYDQIEALWNKAEEDLKRFRVPHAVEHRYASEHEGNYPIYYSLLWVKHGKAWRICHEQCNGYNEVGMAEFDEIDRKPITECPLDLRVSMISEFENLRRKVIEAAENTVPTLDEAISSFRKILKG